jgi:hypothetical protein
MWHQNPPPPFPGYVDGQNTNYLNQFQPGDVTNPQLLPYTQGSPSRHPGDATNQLFNQFSDSHPSKPSGDATNQLYKQFLDSANPSQPQDRPEIVTTNSKIISPKHKKKNFSSDKED